MHIAQYVCNRSIFALLETRSPQGRPVQWIGTGGGGVLRLEEGRVTRSLEADGLPDPWIYELAEVRGKMAGYLKELGVDV